MGQLAMPLMVAGTALEMYGKYKQAKAQKKQGKMQRKMDDDAALVEIAVGQQRARSVTRQTEFLASRALAVAAASGADASGTQIKNIIADIDGEGAYRAAIELYNGEANARKLRLSGYYAEKTGRSQAQATQVSIAGDVLNLGAMAVSSKSKKPA